MDQVEGMLMMRKIALECGLVERHDGGMLRPTQPLLDEMDSRAGRGEGPTRALALAIESRDPSGSAEERSMMQVYMLGILWQAAPGLYDEMMDEYGSMGDAIMAEIGGGELEELFDRIRGERGL